MINSHKCMHFGQELVIAIVVQTLAESMTPA